MEDFICDAPILMQDGAGFGLKAWIIPVVILSFTCLSLLRHLKYPKTPVEKSSIGPWALALTGSAIFLLSANLTLGDHAYKTRMLSSGEHLTYEGRLTVIERVPAFRSAGLITDKYRFYIDGNVKSPDGRTHKLSNRRYPNFVTSKNAIMNVGGKSCFGLSCGLTVGDRVRIKAPNSRQDTLRIEKCTKP